MPITEEKYDSSSIKSPEEFGIFYEETVEATDDDEITLSFYPATQMKNEYLCYDPNSIGGHIFGVVRLYNTTTSTNVLHVGGNPNISSVTDNVLTMGGSVTDGDSILASYYISPFNPSPYLSYKASKEQIWSLVNAMNFKSPIHLPSLGYKYSQNLACKRHYGTYLENAICNIDLLTDPVHDFCVERETEFPVFITEVNVYTQDTYLRFTLSWNRGGDMMTNYQHDLGQVYFDAASCSSLYPIGTNGYRHINIPLLLLKCHEFEVIGFQIPGQENNNVLVTISGWYMPRAGVL